MNTTRCQSRYSKVAGAIGGLSNQFDIMERKMQTFEGLHIPLSKDLEPFRHSNHKSLSPTTTPREDLNRQFLNERISICRTVVKVVRTEGSLYKLPLGDIPPNFSTRPSPDPHVMHPTSRPFLPPLAHSWLRMFSTHHSGFPCSWAGFVDCYSWQGPIILWVRLGLYLAESQGIVVGERASTTSLLDLFELEEMLQSNLVQLLVHIALNRPEYCIKNGDSLYLQCGILNAEYWIMPDVAALAVQVNSNRHEALLSLGLSPQPSRGRLTAPSPMLDVKPGINEG